MSLLYKTLLAALVVLVAYGLVRSCARAFGGGR